MPDPSDLDPKAVRLQFARRARRIADGDFLLREVERRMLERLDVVRLEPRRVLDVGTGLGHGATRLHQRYPQAEVIGIDVAQPMAAEAARLHGAPALRSRAARLRRWFGGATQEGAAPLFVAGDARSLPLAPASVDLLWSNLVWHWFDDPRGVLDEWRRVARAGGLLMFSAFGVDTLRELRGLGLRLPPMHDMHDIGDALVMAGFAEPVMDAEHLTVTWDSAAKLLGELRALGGDALRDRRPGLRGRGARQRWLEAIESLATADGRIAITFEIVYGHAWCPERRKLPPGYSPVDFVGKGPGGSGRYPSG
jgi:malonyl-CoA O-methyltransferase